MDSSKNKKSSETNKKSPSLRLVRGAGKLKRNARITVTGQEASSGRKVRPTVHPRVHFCCLRGRGIAVRNTALESDFLGLQSIFCRFVAAHSLILTMGLKAIVMD